MGYSSFNPATVASGDVGGGTGGADITLLQPVANVRDFGAVGNTQTVCDVAITSGTNVLNSATANFVAADIGKTICVLGAGGGPHTFMRTTITGVNSPTQCTFGFVAAKHVS